MIEDSRKDDGLATIYPLTEPLPACSDNEIDSTFIALDDWQSAIDRGITLDDFYKTFPQYSGGEGEVIYNSWKKAAGRMTR